jgi:hypothetical protein
MLHGFAPLLLCVDVQISQNMWFKCSFFHKQVYDDVFWSSNEFFAGTCVHHTLMTTDAVLSVVTMNSHL